MGLIVWGHTEMEVIICSHEVGLTLRGHNMGLIICGYTERELIVCSHDEVGLNVWGH